MLKNFIARFRRDEKGASMVEYAVALLVVTAVGVSLMGTLGKETGLNVDDACGVLQNKTITASTTGDCT